jgi:hypothetical protein
MVVFEAISFTLSGKLSTTKWPPQKNDIYWLKPQQHTDPSLV